MIDAAIVDRGDIVDEQPLLEARFHCLEVDSDFDTIHRRRRMTGTLHKRPASIFTVNVVGVSMLSRMKS